MGLLLGVLGCGSSKTSTHSASVSEASTLAAWRASTQQLCTEKRSAIAGLGNVDITYGGIARLGLPAVKRLLDGYLGRVIGVVDTFDRRGRALATPPSVKPTIALAFELDRETTAATS